MKAPLLSLTLVILFVAPVFAQADHREVDLRIRGVGSGSSESQVLARIGNPTRRRSRKHLTFAGDCLGMDATFVFIEYPGLKLVLLGDRSGNNLRVVEMQMTSGRRLASGIALGATEAQVRRKFGEPISVDRASGQTEFFYVTRSNQGGVKFVFTQGRLTMIGMSETLC
jgi:hypothetical protein